MFVDALPLAHGSPSVYLCFASTTGPVLGAQLVPRCSERTGRACVRHITP